MAEQLLSPGTLLREVDQSFLPPRPIEVGAAIIGPTVKGPVNIPTTVSSYPEYVARFGNNFEYEDEIQGFFTSIAAYNYFNEGGSTLLVTRVVSGSYEPATAEIEDSGSAGTLFTLETLAEGVDQNSEDTPNVNNIKWEITSVNDNKETFNLLILRGDSDETSKVILERFNNVSLDKDESNFISRVIGDMKQEVESDGDFYYLQSVGNYENKSKYVRIKEVASWETGNPLPESSMGGFENGSGAVKAEAKFYKEIDGTDSQGLVGGNYDIAISLLSNPDEFQYDIIITPGLIYDDHSSQINNLISNIESRGDAIYPIDLVGYGTNLSSVYDSKPTSNYSTTYWPWVQVSDPDTNKLVWVPASTLIPGVYKFNDISGEIWSAPAGINRGGLSLVKQVERKLTVPQRNELYENNVNPIATFPGTGIVVYGQKTLQERASALDRVNVRRLLIDVKNFVRGVTDRLTFEQNTELLRNQFINSVTPRLEVIQQRGGLYAFKIIMDDGTPDIIDRNELVGGIYLQPTKTAEFIYIDFVLTPTGATFPE